MWSSARDFSLLGGARESCSLSACGKDSFDFRGAEVHRRPAREPCHSEMQLGDVARKALCISAQFSCTAHVPLMAPSPEALSDFPRTALVSSWIPSLVWAPRQPLLQPHRTIGVMMDLISCKLRPSSAHGQALFFNCTLALLSKDHPPLQTHQLVHCVQVVISNRNKVLVSCLKAAHA